MLDIFITALSNPMDFKLQMGRLLAILGVYLSIFFSMWPSVVMCIVSCLGW